MRNGTGAKAGGNIVLRRISARWQLYLMIAPALVYILLFIYKPMYGVIIAFKDYKLSLGVWGSEWTGFDNFVRLFHSYWFPIIIKNTLSISVLALIIGFPFPIILALMVNEIRSMRLQKAFQVVSYAPHFISTVVMCGVVILFLSPDSGIINHLLNAFGIKSVFFMQEAKMFKWIYVISEVWQHAGWGAIIYYAALAGVDKQIIEAAKIDGTNRFQIVQYINFPVLIPTMTILFILNCGNLLSVGYEKVYLLQNSINLSGSEVISTYVYKMGLERKDFGFSTATGLFNSVINCVILITVNWAARRMNGTSLW